MASTISRFHNTDDAPTTWKEMFSGNDKIMVSATASYFDDRPRNPRILRITMKFPPLAPCGLVKNADGTCAVRPILDSDKRLEILRTVLKDNLYLPEKAVSGSVPVQSKQSRSGSDESGCVTVKQQESKPRFDDDGLELRLKESKRKLNQQYQNIEDRRKRIKVIDSGDVPVPPEAGGEHQEEVNKNQNFGRFWC